MFLTRTALLICAIMLGTAAISLMIGGNTWLWIFIAWMLGGPAVLIYAYAAVAPKYVTTASGTKKPMSLVGTASLQTEKFASCYQDNHDILP